MEMAMEDFQNALPSASAADEPPPLSLGDAMSYIRRPTPPA